MKMFYITLNTNEEARLVSVRLLEEKLAVCTNWFPINCAYRLEGQIKMDNEVVLIVKTNDDMREQIENVISSIITYKNFIAELDVHSVNAHFIDWMKVELAYV